MKTRVVIEVGDCERYVIAKYFANRSRATRLQVRLFAAMAVRTMVNEQARALRGRQAAAARRLAQMPDMLAVDGRDALRRPSEVQPSLL